MGSIHQPHPGTIGERLPQELLPILGNVRSAVDAQLAAAQDASQARRRGYAILQALPDDHWYCYEVRGGRLDVLLPGSPAVHQIRIKSGRVALGREILLPPTPHTQYIGAFSPHAPNDRPGRKKPVLPERVDRVWVALFDAAFADGSLSIVDKEAASGLVDDGYRVIDPGELVNIWNTSKLGGVRSPRSRSTRSRASLHVV